MADKASILKEAQKQLAKGAVDKAIAELERLVKESPDGNTFNMIGDLYLKKGAQKAATDHYQKAAIFFWHEGFSQKAQALYKKILNINPSDADALYAFGELSEEKGLVTDAIKYYLSAADILAKEGRKEKIIDIYTKILSLSPANIPLRTKVADIFLKEGLKSNAAAEYLRIAHFADEKGDVQKAKECFQKAIDIQPLNKEATLGLSRLLEKTDEIRPAMEQMKDAIVLFPEDLDILNRCTEVSLLSGNIDTAKACLTRILAKEPGNIKARMRSGELFLRDGEQEKAWEQYLPVLDEVLTDKNYEDAIEFLETFKPLDPVETGRRLASLYRQLGDLDRACEELIVLGDVYTSRGMGEEAQSCYRETLQIDPDHAVAALKLAPSQPVYEQEPKPLQDKEIPLYEPTALDVPAAGEATIIEPQAAEEKGPSQQAPALPAKSYEDVITEADIFSRYGLLHEAQKLLEQLRERFPDNIDLHLRLKTLYQDVRDRKSAVTECIILNELYTLMQDPANAEQALKDAFEIDPDDPRLAGHGIELPTALASRSPAAGFGEALSLKEPDIEDYAEEIAEADFYARQGLTAEAIKILDKLNTLFPHNRSVVERLQALDQSPSLPDTEEFVEDRMTLDTFALPESAELPAEFEIPVGFGTSEDDTTSEEGSQDEAFELQEDAEMIDAFKETAEIPMPDEPAPVRETHSEAEPPTDDKKYEDFSFSDEDFLEAQELPEPAMDSDVLEIFQEFKKGLEEQLDDEDSETHYNLGIAYKEMGLVDDAIKEFQTSRNDPKRFTQSSTMLGICYMEKGLYSLAVDVLVKALHEMKEQDESYWALTYELAEAHEKNKDLREALELYTLVYGWNAKFRDVSGKMALLGSQVPKTSMKDQDQAENKPKARKDRVSYL